MPKWIPVVWKLDKMQSILWRCLHMLHMSWSMYVFVDLRDPLYIELFLINIRFNFIFSKGEHQRGHWLTGWFLWQSTYSGFYRYFCFGPFPSSFSFEHDSLKTRAALLRCICLQVESFDLWQAFRLMFSYKALQCITIYSKLKDDCFYLVNFLQAWQI